MDPLTIIGAVATISKTAYSAYNNLYTFINETKDVDQTVIELAKEVHALNRALEGVKAGLESRTVADAGKRRSDKDNKKLWHTVYGALMDCRTTVSTVKDRLGS
ncbi:hypothetical protein GJ744_004068 [Endocarpon pusillum]|uniref:Fungal N-terminal domain-containing protein n=1 Tax=Endocarpon pusillum TaxID=364733 RepID=A0A8H7ADH4_9EURO|nr:hypothetical protein GJ744_004068 [Endocarpon pusillum]